MTPSQFAKYNEVLGGLAISLPREWQEIRSPACASHRQTLLAVQYAQAVLFCDANERRA